ncbi:MAG: hypothetical protein K0Q59_1671 [Paenibacillus sp.]|jgi:AraC-like DNA-binding protein|nr:hypothetical protein [Paenibacillus sp.]
MAFYTIPSSMDGWYLRIRSAYERESSPENHIGTYVIPATLIWMIVSGEKQIEKQGVRYVLKRGDIVVLSPQDQISFDWAAEPFQFFSVAFHATVGALHLPRYLSIPFHASIREHRDETIARLAGIWRQLIEELDLLEQSVNLSRKLSNAEGGGRPRNVPMLLTTKQSVGYMRVHSYLMHLLSEILDAIGGMPAQPVPVDPRIEDICLYVHNHLSEPLHPSALAKRAFVSAGHFRYLFRETFGVSPSDYIRQARIQKAQEMLQSSTLSVKSIAEATGFADYRKLIRVFKQENGISPTEFRKKVRRLDN